MTEGWWERFRARHPNLTLRKGEPLSRARMKVTDRSVLDRYDDLLYHILVSNDLLNKPAQIFNCDETGIPLCHKTGKVITDKKQKHPYTVTSGDKTQITVLACGNAAGYAIPPMVIYDRKGLNPEWLIGEVPGTAYGLSDNGWMDSELFLGWFQNHFLHTAPKARPLLLIMDGHSTHYNPTIIRKAMAENVIMFCLPPNTTHLTQPLDKTCFSVLKYYWSQGCHLYMRHNPAKVVNRSVFSQLFGKAWSQALTIGNVTASFTITGIHPFNRHAISLPGEDTQDTVGSSRQFLPLISTPPCQGQRVKELPAHAHFSVTDITATLEHLDIESNPQAAEDELQHPAQAGEYTEDEELLFQRRYEEGYDLTTDERYNQWLKFNHPNSALTSQLTDKRYLYDKIIKRAKMTEEISAGSGLTPLDALHQQDLRESKGKETGTSTACARVMTSEENLKFLEEKERRKQEEKEKKRKSKERTRREGSHQKQPKMQESEE